jgi:hypothetical protein
VFTFGYGGLQEVGAFIDKGGNNFWGVEPLQGRHGRNMFATSDRDFGLGNSTSVTFPSAGVESLCVFRP